MRLLITVFLIIPLISCASTPDGGSGYTFDEIRVVNNSTSPIQNLNISQSGSGMVISCGDIVALGLCSKRIGRRSYSESPFKVDWSIGNNARKTDSVDIKVPAYNAPGNPLYAVFAISPEGGLSAELVQKIPP